MSSTTMDVDDHKSSRSLEADDEEHRDEKPHALKTDHSRDADNDENDDSASLSLPSSAVTYLDIEVKLVGKSENDALHLSLPQQACVSDLKQSIADSLLDEETATVIPVDRQRLIFRGRLLRQDDQTLESDLHMEAAGKNVVHLAPLPKGVMASVRTERELGMSALNRGGSNNNDQPQRHRHHHHRSSRHHRRNSNSTGESSRARRRRHRLERSGHPYASVHPTRLHEAAMAGARARPDTIYVPTAATARHTTTAAALASSIAQSFPPDVIEQALRELLGTAPQPDHPTIAALLEASSSMESSLWSALQETVGSNPTTIAVTAAPAPVASHQWQPWMAPAPAAQVPTSSATTIDQFLSLAQLVQSAPAPTTAQPLPSSYNRSSSNMSSSAAVLASLLSLQEQRPTQPQPSTLSAVTSSSQHSLSTSTDGQLLGMLEQIARNANDMASVLRLLQENQQQQPIGNAALSPNNNNQMTSLWRDFFAAASEGSNSFPS